MVREVKCSICGKSTDQLKEWEWIHTYRHFNPSSIDVLCWKCIQWWKHIEDRNWSRINQ